MQQESCWSTLRRGPSMAEDAMECFKETTMVLKLLTGKSVQSSRMV